MGYSVRIAEAFEEDLFGVLSYLIETCDAKDVAKRIMQEVDRAKDLLAAQPFIHAVSKKPRLVGSAYREHFIMGYVIVYRVDEGEGPVPPILSPSSVVRILRDGVGSLAKAAL